MGVSVEWFGEIAADLGLTRPALYKYVVDREDLLFRCYNRSCEWLEQAVGHALEAGGSAMDIVDTFLKCAVPANTPEVAVLSEIEALRPDQRRVVRARWEQSVSRLARVLDAGILERRFRPMDTSIVANALIGMVSWVPLHARWAQGSGLTPGEAGIREIAFSGLAADRGGAFDAAFELRRREPAKLDPFDRRSVEAAKREAILVTAAGLFNRRGIGATRVEDIGAAVNLSKRATYHHIGSKDALINACIARTIQFCLGVMEEAEAAPKSRLEAYHAAIKRIVNTYCDREQSVLVPYVGAGLLSAEGQAAMGDFSQRLTDGYRKMFLDGEREGSMRVVALDEVLAVLPGVFSWAANSPPDSPTKAAHIAQEIATLTVRGILG